MTYVLPVLNDVQKVTRREASKAGRRDAIISLAQEAFLEQGFDRTSMSAIAEKMGGSKSTLWNYFASKEQLFATVLDVATSAFWQTMSTVLDAARPVDEVLTEFVQAYMLRIARPDAIALQRLIISEVERFPEIGRIFYERAPGASRAHVADYLESQMASARLRRADADEAADILLRLCLGGYPQRIMWGVEIFKEEAILRDATGIVSHFIALYAPVSI